MIERFYKTYDLTRYIEFIEECRQKDYSGCGTHKHHIIPKFMGGQDIFTNTILLSYDDHKIAHIVLAECFPETTNYYRGNICAAHYIQNWIDAVDVDLRIKLSIAMKYRIISDETKKKLSEFAKNRIFSDETRLKMSESRKKFCETEEGLKLRAANSIKYAGSGNPFYGKKHTPEQIIKMQISRIGLNTGEDCYMYGVPKSDEIKEKISKTLKEKYQSGEIIHPRLGKEVTQETRDKISKGNKGKTLSEEEKQRLSILMKGNSFAKKRPCSIDGKVYDSIVSASITLGYSESYVRNRIKSSSYKWKSWIYVEMGEKDNQ
jgi:hypothetical protein